METEIIREPELLQMLKVSRSTIRRQMRAGRFPRPIPVGSRAKGWVKREIEIWIKTQQLKRAA